MSGFVKSIDFLFCLNGKYSHVANACAVVNVFFQNTDYCPID